MHSTPPAFARVLPGLFLATVLLLAAGCASDDARPPRGAGKHREAFPTMAGEQTFFSGTLKAEVLVGAMTGFDLHGGPGGADGGRRPGGGMRMRATGGMHYGDQRAREPDQDSDVPGRQQAMATQRADRMGSPPVMIHLRFINTGSAKMDVVIADFLSPLGNFVVQPEKFSLEPGQELAVEPMTSRLAGDPSDGEISLSLKSGGVTEAKTITLALRPEATIPAAEPAK